MSKVIDVVKLDLEWIQLIREAKELGMSIEDVRTFLTEAKH
ncbi:anti-repressor SinI family protein [Ornithinibacillus halotolerans]|uniref:DNA-binding anti-repressor SinI n=1 Tax=Ornithinibacillus halotolerans TaxID=1274357 RepID=A0A916W5E6_9BACI|nr:anti-repressor SinI family protein [Ornithinibacillus halotolerans]GGA67075.1 hypothetical protein GCM10008025_08620 [Ornithinibacillus halotolerans]